MGLFCIHVVNSTAYPIHWSNFIFSLRRLSHLWTCYIFEDCQRSWPRRFTQYTKGNGESWIRQDVCCAAEKNEIVKRYGVVWLCKPHTLPFSFSFTPWLRSKQTSLFHTVSLGKRWSMLCTSKHFIRKNTHASAKWNSVEKRGLLSTESWSEWELKAIEQYVNSETVGVIGVAPFFTPAVSPGYLRALPVVLSASLTRGVWNGTSNSWVLKDLLCSFFLIQLRWIRLHNISLTTEGLRRCAFLHTVSLFRCTCNTCTQGACVTCASKKWNGVGWIRKTKIVSLRYISLDLAPHHLILNQ